MMERNVAGDANDDEFLDGLRIDWRRQRQAFLYVIKTFIFIHVPGAQINKEQMRTSVCSGG